MGPDREETFGFLLQPVREHICLFLTLSFLISRRLCLWRTKALSAQTAAEQNFHLRLPFFVFVAAVDVCNQSVPVMYHSFYIRDDALIIWVTDMRSKTRQQEILAAVSSIFVSVKELVDPWGAKKKS